MAERRKNWFSRQITRMGSARSASTAYSSGGIFNRNRHNSVYSSPEAGLVPNQQTQKMSLYDKFVGRKSLRAQRQMIKQSKYFLVIFLKFLSNFTGSLNLDSKQNLNGSVHPKARPRIPTPDVTKDTVNEKLSTTPTTGIGVVSQMLATNPSIYPSMNQSDLPLVGLLLTPIKETESNSVNSTLQAGNPATQALANSVLASSIAAAGLTTTDSGGGSVFVIPTTAEATTIPITTIITNSNSNKDEPSTLTSTTTLLHAFPVHKSSSFTDVSRIEEVKTPAEAETITISQDPDIQRHHSLSEPASKTSTLTKREVYV